MSKKSLTDRRPLAKALTKKGRPFAYPQDYKSEILASESLRAA
jgi:hypothetical protein